MFRWLTSRKLAGVIVLGAVLSYAALSADGPQDALVIEKDGAVRVNTALYGKGAVPVGSILMWSGDPAKLPAGWVLCDGKNETPDLSGRFIVGYGPGAGYRTMKEPGGILNNTVSLPDLGDHTHNVTTSPISAVHAHTHNVDRHYHNGGLAPTQWAGPQTTNRADPTTVGIGVGNPYTGGVVATKPVAKTLDNRPPYMVLAYIMYIGK